MQFKEIDEISSIQTGEVNYYSEGRPCFGYIAHDKNREGKLPVVIIVHVLLLVILMQNTRIRIRKQQYSVKNLICPSLITPRQIPLHGKT